ncbi:hypothetical protein H7Y40_02490 [Pedobacter sp.]|nr:hypothetical protein [Candidatus Saccharibacteria bacterium]
MKNLPHIHPYRSRESGVVSIFIVIFFMIFMSVIVVGFVKTVNDDQAQATDSDLSASALASAQSGAEDGKRVLLLCKTPATPAIAAACATVLTNPACSAVTSNATLVDSLNIDVDTAGGRSDGIVSGNSEYQQRYTCMTIKTKTSSVEGLSVAKNASELIPLTADGGTFDSVQFSWHATAETRDGALTAFRTINPLGLPAQDQWKNASGASYAAAMRLEFIAYPKTGVNLNTLDADTRTVLLLPGSASTPVATINLNALDIRDTNPSTATEYSPQLVRCQATGEYGCTSRIQLAGTPSPATYSYFLRVSSLYSSAYIKAELKNAAGGIVQFDNVQPVIDVTGRANDVFRRIQTRVQYDASMYLPQYAVEVNSLCKNMTVTDVNATSSDVCNP